MVTQVGRNSFQGLASQPSGVNVSFKLSVFAPTRSNFTR